MSDTITTIMNHIDGRKDKHFIITGNAGIGKTTLISYICLFYKKQNNKNIIVLNLKDFVDNITTFSNNSSNDIIVVDDFLGKNVK